ncbi:hypothetical protein [Rubripirellula reticaptiva]|uniref:Uncharacterized protein n=1 Tax=Rubripirellula reticaptiva TaxID=2528013 RepID=A0A5C6FBQ3_9BACT|nr:hypothetical protein [Rubripirellula reticaptiva]TWU58010.1 hypothetical protein Poly59_09190 [Rubripirellula reticaptiva]
MNKHHLSIIAIALPLLWSSASESRADFLFQFGQGTNVDLTNFTVVAGESLTLDIYLTASQSEMRLQTLGVGTGKFNFGISGDTNVTHADASSVVVSSDFPNTPIVALDDPQSLDVQLTRPTAPGGVTVVPITSNTSLFLVQTTIDTNLLASGQYAINLAADSDFGFVLGPQVLSIPNTIFPTTLTGTLTVVSVPEASSLAMVAAVAWVGMLRFWRLKRHLRIVSPSGGQI